MSYERRLAQRIYSILQQYVPAEDSRRLRKVVVRCGEMDALDADRLAASWPEVAVGPAYRDSYIELHRDEAEARCVHCNHVFPVADRTSACPRCGHEQFSIVHQPPRIETFVLE